MFVVSKLKFVVSTLKLVVSTFTFVSIPSVEVNAFISNVSSFLVAMSPKIGVIVANSFGSIDVLVVAYSPY